MEDVHIVFWDVSLWQHVGGYQLLALKMETVWFAETVFTCVHIFYSPSGHEVRPQDIIRV